MICGGLSRSRILNKLFLKGLSLFFCQFNPDRSMIAGFFPTPHMTINAGGFEAAFKLRVEQKMINAQSGIPSIGIPEIVPERIYYFIRIKFPDCISPSLGFQVFECL